MATRGESTESVQDGDEGRRVADGVDQFGNGAGLGSGRIALIRLHILSIKLRSGG